MEIDWRELEFNDPLNYARPGPPPPDPPINPPPGPPLPEPPKFIVPTPKHPLLHKKVMIKSGEFKGLRAFIKSTSLKGIVVEIEGKLITSGKLQELPWKALLYVYRFSKSLLYSRIIKTKKSRQTDV